MIEQLEKIKKYFDKILIKKITKIIIISTILVISINFIWKKFHNNVILTYGNKKYTANFLYENNKEITDFYYKKFDVVYKILVQKYFDKYGKKYKKQVDCEARIILNEKKQLIAKKFKKSKDFNVKWKEFILENNVKNEQELFQKFKYECQKEKLRELFYDNNYDVLKDGGKLKGIDYDNNKITLNKEVNGYLNEKHPYHIKHILVKIASKTNENGLCNITTEEASKLSRVIQAFASGLSFERTSSLINEDVYAKNNNSDIGIVDFNSNVALELKMGIYMYESFFDENTKLDFMHKKNQKYNQKSALKEIFNLGENDNLFNNIAFKDAEKASKLKDPTTMRNNIGVGIGQIPFESALILDNKKYNIDNNKDENKMRSGLGGIDFNSQHFKGIVDDDFKYYPRNIIFNKYFNKKNINVITPNFTCLNDVYNLDKYAISKKINDLFDTDSDFTFSTINNFWANAFPGFLRVGKNNSNIDNMFFKKNNKFLRDENGRTILVFYSDDADNPMRKIEDNIKKLSDEIENTKDKENEENRKKMLECQNKLTEESNNLKKLEKTISDFHGINFIVIERSPFIFYEYKNDEKNVNSTFDTYYNYDCFNKNLKTYVNFYSRKRDNRINEIKNKLKNYIDNEIIDIYIYQFLNIFFEKNKIKINKLIDKNISDEIEKTINFIKENNNFIHMANWNKFWELYNKSINYNLNQRLINNPQEVLAAMYKSLDGFKGEKDKLDIINFFGNSDYHNLSNYQ